MIHFANEVATDKGAEKKKKFVPSRFINSLVPAWLNVESFIGSLNFNFLGNLDLQIIDSFVSNVEIIILVNLWTSI